MKLCCLSLLLVLCFHFGYTQKHKAGKNYISIGLARYYIPDHWDPAKRAKFHMMNFEVERRISRTLSLNVGYTRWFRNIDKVGKIPGIIYRMPFDTSLIPGERTSTGDARFLDLSLSYMYNYEQHQLTLGIGPSLSIRNDWFFKSMGVYTRPDGTSEIYSYESFNKNNLLDIGFVAKLNYRFQINKFVFAGLNGNIRGYGLGIPIHFNYGFNLGVNF